MRQISQNIFGVLLSPVNLHRDHCIFIAVLLGHFCG